MKDRPKPMVPGAPASPSHAPDRTPTGAGRGRPPPAPALAPGTGLSARPALALSYIVAGLLCLLGATAWLALQPGLVRLPYVHPHVVGLMHLWLPGFLLTVCLGAVYQLAPVILGARLAGVRAAWWHLGLHLTGLLLLVPGLALGRYLAAALGGTLIAIGGVIGAIVVGRTYLASSRRDAIAACLPLSTGWLALTFVLGVITASNRHTPWIPVSILSLLGAHAHLGLAGFFLTLLQGAGFQLVPMFTLGSAQRPRCIAAGLICTQVGLPLLALGLGLERSPLATLGALLLLGGIVCSGAALVATLHSRRKPKLETPLRAFLTGLGLLATAAIGVTLTRLLHSGAWPSPVAVSLYGLVLVPGALALAVMGMLLKIVPFLTWMQAYGPKVGKQTVPRATDLSRPRLEAAWFTLHLAALSTLCVAMWWVAPVYTSRVGGLTLFAAAAIYLINLCKILCHLRPTKASSK